MSLQQQLGWMAWTWPTAGFFMFVLASIIVMGVIEALRPGGGPRNGILGLTTTRGDRLFISYLGSAFIFLGWLWLVDDMLWGVLVVIALWWSFIFWKA